MPQATFWVPGPWAGEENKPRWPLGVQQILEPYLRKLDFDKIYFL
jgi:hypothetical protein